MYYDVLCIYLSMYYADESVIFPHSFLLTVPAYTINRLKPAPWWNQPISLLTFFGHNAHSIVADCTRAALPPPWIFVERHLSSKSSGAHEIVNACEECTASHRISPDGFKRSGCYFVQSSCWCTGQRRVEGIIWSHHADQAVEPDLTAGGCSTAKEN